jgi:hypothetical protein
VVSKYALTFSFRYWLAGKLCFPYVPLPITGPNAEHLSQRDLRNFAALAVRRELVVPPPVAPANSSDNAEAPPARNYVATTADINALRAELVPMLRDLNRNAIALNANIAVLSAKVDTLQSNLANTAVPAAVVEGKSGDNA